MEHPNTEKLAYLVQQLPGAYKNPKDKHAKVFVDAVIEHMWEYLHSNGIKKTNVSEVLVRLRGAYGAPKSNNNTVKVVRQEGEEVVRKLTGIKTPMAVQSLRAGLSLYIVIRILSKDLYD